MRKLTMSCLLLLSSALLALGACSDKKNSVQEAIREATSGSAEEATAAACETNGDCQQGEVCLANLCAKTNPGAIYTDPKNAVTSDKVKAQMDAINKAAEERVDKILDEAEGK